MRSLFATILAVSASTSALPAIATSVSDSVSEISAIRQSSVNYLSALPAQQKTSATDAYTFTQRSLSITKQIPSDTIGLVIIDLDPLSWQAFDKFDLPIIIPISALDNLIDKLMNFLGESSPISIVKDVQPWLGKEVMITFLNNPNSKAKNKAELVFAALSMVTDDKQFEIFIEKVKGLNTLKPTETLYQNIKILEWELKDEVEEENEPESLKKSPKRLNTSQTLRALSKTKNHEEIKPSFSDFRFKRLAIAKLPSGFAVIASDREAIQKMIDTSASNSELQSLSLADNPIFLRSLNNPLWNRSLFVGYGDFKGLGQFTELLAADLPETSEIPGFSRAEYIQSLKHTLSQYSSFDLFAWVTPKGLRSQSSSYFSEVRSPQPKDTQTRDRLLSYLPSNVYGSISSRNFNRQWQWFVEASKLEPTYKIFVDGLRVVAPMILGEESGIDIEKDIISWMDGEYAFVAFPSDRSPLKQIGVTLTSGMLIRTSKPEAANAALAKLTKYITNLGKGTFQVKKRQVGATLLTSFEFPDFQEQGKTQSVFAYGWRDRQTLMLTFGSDTATAFIPTPKPSLAESEMFRDAIADMPQPNFGYFYLNANAIAKQVATGYFTFSEWLAPDNAPNSDGLNKLSQSELAAPILRAIDKLGGSVFVYSETSDRFQADFFLGLKP